MLEVLLHAGAEHPNVWWIVVPSVLSFLAGLGIGATGPTDGGILDQSVDTGEQ